MYKQPEQTYSSIYSDAPKSEEKTTASYGYQQAAGQTAEAYYAQQEAISIMQQQQQEYEKQAAAYKRRERSRSPEVKRRERSRSPYKYREVGEFSFWAKKPVFRGFNLKNRLSFYFMLINFSNLPPLTNPEHLDAQHPQNTLDHPETLTHGTCQPHQARREPTKKRKSWTNFYTSTNVDLLSNFETSWNDQPRIDHRGLPMRT